MKWTVISKELGGRREELGGRREEIGVRGFFYLLTPNS
jgi:hypothetical protein